MHMGNLCVCALCAFLNGDLTVCCLQIGRPLYTQESVSPVGGGAARQQSQSVLLVDEVRDVDQGTYTCTAHNLQGAKSASTTVKVVPKAKPKKP